MDSHVENRKYKLLGFENSKSLAIIMIVSTGKVMKIKLDELLKSEIVDDLKKSEMKSVYRKFYSGGVALTAYEVSDRNEKSWLVYVVLNLLLFALYMFTNMAATKLVHVEFFDVVVTPGVFLYPLTFLIVDMLNEFYGLRLARRAIFLAFAINAFVMVLLTATIGLPGVAGWELDGPYGVVITHVSGALLASSISFVVSEYFNAYLLNKIKELTRSRFLFLRVFLSTLFAAIIDSFIFCFIAFYGKMANAEILAIVYVQIVIKVAFAVFNIVPAYGARSLFNKYVVGVKAA